MMMNTIDRSKAAFVAACFAALALLPWLAGSYGVDLVTKIMVYAVFALSLELLVGATGLVCFGQAAFFGIGAYAAVLLSPASEPAISERKNSSFSSWAWALSCMCSSITRLSAMLRMPLNPTSVTARDTVLMLPPRA